MGIGWTELMIVLLIVLVLFGGSRIASVMGGLGRGVKEFKKGMSADDEDDKGPKKGDQAPG
jgi:sec-independent protein translocase protein TatA